MGTADSSGILYPFLSSLNLVDFCSEQVCVSLRFLRIVDMERIYIKLIWRETDWFGLVSVFLQASSITAITTERDFLKVGNTGKKYMANLRGLMKLMELRKLN